MKIMIY